ncbi:hypothetical protein Fmac_011515 [Flemingia macrophylla]|uniref:Uncharacterized protein n=1 Tax=Flemingia macrophylla TaxID=520843 RepID=A0ABD1MMT1_9FABA
MVNKCKIYDEDNRARVAHYKSGVLMRNQNKHDSTSRSKPYSRPAGSSNGKGGRKKPWEQVEVPVSRRLLEEYLP